MPVVGDVDVGRVGHRRGRRHCSGQKVRNAAGGPVDQAQRDRQELHAVRADVRLLDGARGQAPGPGGGHRPSRRFQLHPVRAPGLELHPVRPGRSVHARRQQDTQAQLRRGRGRAGGPVRPVNR